MPFNFPFTNRHLTRESRLHPKRYGMVSAMSIFPLIAINSNFVQVTEDQGVLTVVPSTERGAPGAKTKRARQASKIFELLHLPVEDQILAHELQDRLTVIEGQEVPANLPDETAKRLDDLMRRLAITAEWHRVGALKGVIRDADNEILTNLFDDFGVSQTTIDFALGNANTDVQAKDEELRGTIEDAILGDTVTGVEVLVDSSFFSKLTQHAKVAELYKNSPDVGQLREFYRQRTGGISGRVFNPFGGVTYIEYRGSAPLPGGPEKFIEADTGYAYPTGTENVFATYGGPANTMAEVNDLPAITEMDFADGVEPFALPAFVSSEPLKHGQGVEFWAETNILALCKQPKGLVKITA